MAADKKGGLGDDQGTRVGKPNRPAAASHSDTPPARPERVTGVGSEATIATNGEADAHKHEHRSGYGGKGGAPDTSSDKRKNK